MWERKLDRHCGKWCQAMFGISSLGTKALHSELLTKLSGRFPSRNEYFVISEVRVEHHFFVIFGKFGISKFLKFPNIRKNQFPKFPNFFRNLPNFFRTFSELFSELFPNFLTEKLKFYIIFLKFSKFTYIFE